ncbi:MAG TPA: hypothetical protein VGP68_15460 [Gemmataceae bacterium]|nr:hypothetical protein [Gemmataceae bacterium]
MNDPVKKIKKSRWRRRWLWLGALVGTPILLLLFTYGYACWAGNRQLNRLLTEIDRQDPDWRQAHLKRRPMPPPEQNGIEQVLAARGAIASLGGWPTWPFPAEGRPGVSVRDLRHAMSESLDDISTSAQFHPEQIRVLRAELQRAEAGLRLARRLVEFPHGQADIKPPKSYFSIALPHLQETVSVAGLLKYDAYLRAQEGDLGRALDDVRAIIHASHAIGDEPYMISQLVRMNIDGMAVGVVQRILGLGVAREDNLKLAQQLLLEEAETEFYRIGARGERALLDEFLAAVQQRDFSFEGFREELSSSGIAFPGGGMPLIEELNAFQLYASVTTQRAELLALTNEAVQAGNLPEAKQQAAFDTLEEKLRQRKPWSLSNIVYPFLFRCGDNSLGAKALLRSAATSVAAERFRLAKGRWPKDLAELVPAFLPVQLKDPFDGKPLRMRSRQDGLVIYALGHNLVDDGGNVTQTAAAPDADVGFLLFDVDKRRLTPRPLKPPLGQEAAPGTGTNLGTIKE